jgi:hypothetical protein
MAKKQTRRSISVSRSTYERLKAFCEANNVSMSQLVETRVNDFLGADGAIDAIRTAPPRPPVPSAAPTMGGSFGSPARPSAFMPARAPAGVPAAAAPVGAPVRPVSAPPAPPAPAAPVPMTSAAARSAIEPPPPIIKPKQETAAPKPAEKRPDQIFTF